MPPPQLAPAENLYLRLRSVGLDPSRVYRIRDVTLDRALFHMTLDDGTIAFTEDVDGHVSGAFFEGDGEVLLTPPDRTERASMALFTGGTILEESFATAYLRFNDQTFSELQPYLRPTQDAGDFVSKWNDTARNLAEADALRLLSTFSRDLPTPNPATKPGQPPDAGNAKDQMLHVRVQGRKPGLFDVYFDTTASEQLWAGQSKTVEDINFYDLWTSFSVAPPGPKNKLEGSTPPSSADFVSITDYRIRARITPPTRLEAEARMHLQVRRGGDRALFFELSRSLQISSLEADGRSLEFIHNPSIEGTQLARRGNDLVAVIFAQPLRAGQVLELRFVYAGDVISEAAPGLLQVGARGTWYPNRGIAMANFDLQFQYPSDWTLVATGKQVEKAAPDPASQQPFDTRAGDMSSQWVSERPIPVAGFNLGKYQRAVAHAGKVAVEAYATAVVERDFPQTSTMIIIPSGTTGLRQPTVVQIPLSPSPARNAQNVAEESASAIDFFSRHFGPYPYSTLALTQMPGAESQGWPGLIYLSSLSFLTADEVSQLHMPDADKAIVKQMAAHEIAHQWWGDTVGWVGYRDQWWVEALANYSSMMLLESQNPSQFHAIMDKYRDDLLEKSDTGRLLKEDGPVTLGTRLSCSEFPSGYTAISYGRGTWLFHMLRHMLRDAERTEGPRKPAASTHSSEEPFMRALLRLRNAYDGRSITSHELLAVFEQELPPSLRYEGRKSLDWFYQGWIDGTAIPRYQLKQVKFADKGGTSVVSGVIVQKDAPNDLVTSVPVYVSQGEKLTLLGSVFADGPETSFHFTAPAGARKVVIDPYETILRQSH